MNWMNIYSELLSFDHLNYVAVEEGILQPIIALYDDQGDEVQHHLGAPDLDGQT